MSQTANNNTVYWTAGNHNSHLRGIRQASSMRAAVRAARNYLRNELYGEGRIAYFDDDPRRSDDFYGPEPVRIDERSLHTNYRWATR